MYVNLLYFLRPTLGSIYRRVQFGAAWSIYRAPQNLTHILEPIEPELMVWQPEDPLSLLETKNVLELYFIHLDFWMNALLTSTSEQKVALGPYCSWHWCWGVYRTPGAAIGELRSLLDGRSSRQKPQPRLRG